MNCAEARPHLPALLYGDLKPEEAGLVEEHLRGCAACQRGWAAFQQLQPLLDAAPVPAVRIDLPRLYREAAERQQRRLRRWRRVALASLAAAAAVIGVVLGLRLEVRMEAHQVVVRWGEPPAVPLVAPPDAPRPAEEHPATYLASARLTDVEKQVRILSELTLLLAANLDDNDLRQRQELVRLELELLFLQQQTAQWRLATDKDVAALYAGQYPSAKKGTSP